MSEKMLQLIEQIKIMNEAAQKINELWDQLEEPEFYDLADDYPFHESFDDVAAKINRWANMYTLNK